MYPYFFIIDSVVYLLNVFVSYILPNINKKNPDDKSGFLLSSLFCASCIKTQPIQLLYYFELLQHRH